MLVDVNAYDGDCVSVQSQDLRRLLPTMDENIEDDAYGDLGVEEYENGDYKKNKDWGDACVSHS